VGEPSEIVLSARGLRRTFDGFEAVRGVSLDVARGEWVSLCGPSGCGKTTLLQMLALLDSPTEGEISFGGVTARSLTPRSRAELRLTRIGFVHQSGNLLPQLSALENVALPHWRLHKSRARAHERAAALLDELALSGRRNTPARALSVGEAQRVALARALSNEPSLVIADEPTGSLDSANAARVLEAFEQVRRSGVAVLLATHDDEGASRGRILRMRDGALLKPG
jgi:ABC-type lipoprotein export system ATPase subunit